jgi:curved DNA-binding protein CbpA
MSFIDSDENIDSIITKMAAKSRKIKMQEEFDDNSDILEEQIKQKPKSKSKSQNKKQDSNTIDIDNTDFSKVDQDTKDACNDLVSGLPDYYKIMGCNLNDSNDEIKRKCKLKLAKHHPDKFTAILEKLPPKERVKEKKLYEMQYKLIRDAYKCLNDPSSRKFYDLQKKTIDSKNFKKQKDSFEEFKKLQESEISEASKSLAELKYKDNFIELDKKNKFDRDFYDTAQKLDKESSTKKISDLMTEREQQDVEYLPKNKFENRTFTPQTFNKFWEQQKRKEEKKKKNDKDDKSVIKWEGIMASNDSGLFGSAEFIGTDANYEDLYDNNDFNNSSFASKLISCSEDDSDSSSIDDDINVDYYELHNKDKNTDIYDKKLEDLIKQRNNDDEIYENQDFSSKMRKSVMDNPMNISSQFGKIIGGESIGGISYNGPSTLTKNKKKLDKDLLEAYKTLVYDKKSDN